MNRIIYCSTSLRCLPSEAFAYFTENQLLETWLTNSAEVQPVPGGKYELFWNIADRENDSTIGCRITAIRPPSLLAFEWKSPKQFKSFANSADPLTHVAVIFSPESSGTTVHLVHSGWRAAQEWIEAADWQEKAWKIAFTALEGRINGVS
jgi:uncharacterized protein YndB with AHSA1/START domain